MNTTLHVSTPFALLLIAGAAGAGMQPARSLEELVGESQAIVVGEAVAARSAWEDGSLVTRYTIRVAETLKGTHEPQIVVSVPGGVDRQRRIPVAMTIAGAPMFMANESLILMLRRAGGARPDDYVVTGFNQGVLRANATSDELPRARSTPDAATTSTSTSARAGSLERMRQRILDIERRGPAAPSDQR